MQVEKKVYRREVTDALQKMNYLYDFRPMLSWLRFSARREQRRSRYLLSFFTPTASLLSEEGPQCWNPRLTQPDTKNTGVRAGKKCPALFRKSKSRNTPGFVSKEREQIAGERGKEENNENKPSSKKLQMILRLV